MRIIKTVVSGGQTGVDRAALDAARRAGVEIGGWCPRGRRAEDGAIPDEYPLMETPSAAYSQRTKWNVRDSDGTLILYRDAMSGGTALTAKLATRLGRPMLAVDLAHADAGVVRQWIEEKRLAVLNVAGPRESTSPAIYAPALAFLAHVLNTAEGA